MVPAGESNVLRGQESMNDACIVHGLECYQHLMDNPKLLNVR